MATKVEMWQCGFCGELKKRQNIAERHEITCLSNPNCKNCLVCVHCIETKEEMYDEGFYTIITTTKTVRRCDLNRSLCSQAVSANCTNFERKEEELL